MGGGKVHRLKAVTKVSPLSLATLRRLLRSAFSLLPPFLDCPPLGHAWPAPPPPAPRCPGPPPCPSPPPHHLLTPPHPPLSHPAMPGPAYLPISRPVLPARAMRSLATLPGVPVMLCSASRELLLLRSQPRSSLPVSDMAASTPDHTHSSSHKGSRDAAVIITTIIITTGIITIITALQASQ